MGSPQFVCFRISSVLILRFPQATAAATEQSAIDTAVHEILHAMFFTDTLMETFIDATGTALGASGAFTTDYAGRKTVKTPTVGLLPMMM